MQQYAAPMPQSAPQYAQPAPQTTPAQQLAQPVPGDEIPGLGSADCAAEPWNSPNLTPEESLEMKNLYSRINELSDSAEIDRLGQLMNKATGVK